MLVREYREEDYEIVDDLLYDVFDVHKVKNSKDDNIVELVGVIDEKVVGYVLLTKIKDYVTGNSICKIDYYCVDKNYRKRGMGKMIIETAIDYIKKWNVIYVELTAGRSRTIAREIYEKEGFVIRDSDIFRRDML